MTFAAPYAGDPLQAYFALPNRTGPVPAVVMLHGCSGLARHGQIFRSYRAWARILTRAGYAVLAVDSAGSRGFGRTCGPSPARKVMYREGPGDAYAALRYLRTRTEIDGARVYLIGWSQGGGITLLTVNSESIGRVALTPPHDFRAAVAFYPAACSDKLQHHPYTSVLPGTWRTVAPVLILHGAADNWTLPGPCVDFVDGLKRRGEPVDITVYPDAAHGFDALDMPLRRRTDVKTARGDAPVVGTHEGARRAAIAAVLAFLKINGGAP